jgi:hypothetical protein
MTVSDFKAIVADVLADETVYVDTDRRGIVHRHNWEWRQRQRESWGTGS